MPPFRHTLSRRDAVLILIGASFMHVWTLLLRPHVDQSIVIDTQYNVSPPAAVDPDPVGAHRQRPQHRIFTVTATTTLSETETVVAPVAAATTNDDRPPMIEHELPHTSIISHAPGWTLFRNLYMSNGTLFILSTNRSFPEIRMMTSTGLPGYNDPENVAAREPTAQHMDIITPEEAQRRWGGRGADGAQKPARVYTVEGNTFLFNDPEQFLRHYYHFVAELFFGAWSFWHGAWSTPTTSTRAAYELSHPSPPPVHRAIFAHSDTNGWHDNPGFNGYFLRAAFPSLTVEAEQDWKDRIASTADADRAWHFPVVLLTDRSAAFRGTVCGSRNQRTAAEAWEYMKTHDQLRGHRVGGWWHPIREAIWRFSGADEATNLSAAASSPSRPDTDGDAEVDDPKSLLPLPDKIIITYISRQGVKRRKLVQEQHDELVSALEQFVARKGSSWELNVLQAENMTKDEQIRAAAKTTILLGVHGNGLTHLVFMKPNRLSAVIEMFYPGGFAYDYQWTSRALGMNHYGVWNDTYYTHPNIPDVAYPEGFQEDYIPIHGPTVVQLIEDHAKNNS